jgi:RNA polymerase sigma factor (sigma-70 family)
MNAENCLQSSSSPEWKRDFFERLFTNKFWELGAFVERFDISGADAADIVQEAFIKLSRLIDSGEWEFGGSMEDSEKRAGKWLLNCVNWASLKYLRKFRTVDYVWLDDSAPVKHSSTEPSSLHGVTPDARALDPAVMLRLNERWQEVEAALAELDGKHYQAIMAWIENWPMRRRELSTLLSVDEIELKSALQYARKKLRTTLAYEEEASDV